jgi:hypothetical protein
MANLTPDHLKSGIALIPLRSGDVPHTIGKFSTRITTLLYTSSQSKVYNKVMGLQSRESPSFGNVGTPTWESQDKNDIRMLVLWLGTKYTIRGKVVASPKSEPW